MKRLKKALAILLSAAMMIGMSSLGFAAAGDRTKDTDISVTELAEGDVVTYYQVIEWKDSDGWVFKAPFNSLSEDDLKEITGTPAVGTTPAVPGKITQDMAKKIAAAATSGGTTDPALTGNTWTKSGAEAGLYMVVIAAGTSGVVYNPVFVAVDFDRNDTNTLDISTASYSNAGIAKKKVITVEKTEKDRKNELQQAIDAYVGQVVDFDIKTTIPVYLPTFTDPSFVITDSVTEGIELDPDSITVTLDPAAAAGVTAYTIDPKAATGFTITFDDDYLKANTVPVEVTVNYSGKITNEAAYNINQDKNTVEVTYSNGPGDEKGALKDISNTYTFSIGALVLGSTQEDEKTSELVKVGIDQNGEYITELREETYPGIGTVGVLPGATYRLSTDSNAETAYVNGRYPNGAEFTTGDDGIVTFKGLSAGTYYITEIDAPDGYIRDKKVYKVVIEAKFNDPVKVTEQINGIDVSYEVVTLKTSSVKIYDGETLIGENTYTTTNEGPTTTTSSSTTQSTELKNVAGAELPATGGMGTTLFYVIGSILVIGAGIVLVAKKRMSAQ